VQKALEEKNKDLTSINEAAITNTEALSKERMM